MLDPTAMILAAKTTRRAVGSARPHAPVIPGGPDRPPRGYAVRLLVASVLRRVASRVEPPVINTCRPAS